MTERKIPLRVQAEAVRESARRATTALIDAQVIWCEGDWRVQQTKLRAEQLAAAADTMEALVVGEQSSDVSVTAEIPAVGKIHLT